MFLVIMCLLFDSWWPMAIGLLLVISEHDSVCLLSQSMRGLW